MDKIAKFSCVENLKKEGNPIVIVSVADEAEAVLNACREIGIKVSAFCDNEKRKTQKPFCGLEVVHTPTLKKNFQKPD